ncbi:MAG TPA: hypothetical protein VFW00_06070 [Rhodocyclaceae bacterium]|nr:hypothetical protein [Rhodocyclaceae bacterium]
MPPIFTSAAKAVLLIRPVTAKAKQVIVNGGIVPALRLAIDTVMVSPLQCVFGIDPSLGTSEEDCSQHAVQLIAKPQKCCRVLRAIRLEPHWNKRMEVTSIAISGRFRCENRSIMRSAFFLASPIFFNPTIVCMFFRAANKMTLEYVNLPFAYVAALSACGSHVYDFGIMCGATAFLIEERIEQFVSLFALCKNHTGRLCVA